MDKESLNNILTISANNIGLINLQERRRFGSPLALFLLFSLLLLNRTGQSQENVYKEPILHSTEHMRTTAASITATRLLLLSNTDRDRLLSWNWKDFSRPLDQSYASSGAMKLADRIILFQRPSGGWSKRYEYDPLEPYSVAQLEQLISRNQQDAETFDKENYSYSVHSHSASTFDNDATTSEIRFLLRVAHVTRGPDYIEAVERGIRYVLNAQYSIGGWPQNYPNLGSYGGYITFNDKVMSNIVRVLEEVKSGDYVDWLDTQLIAAAEAAYWKAIEYILAAQITVNGTKTAWAQQYDGYMPARGRIYEVAAIASFESRDIIRLLKRIENPSQAVLAAINGAIDWAGSVKILGYEYVFVTVPEYNGMVFTYQIREDPAAPEAREYRYVSDGRDRVLRVKSGAGPIWARLYSIDTMQPIFSDWDGQVKTDLSDVQYERRVGYSWYGAWLTSLLEE